MCLCARDCACDAHRSVDVHDHLSSGLVAFAMVCSLLFLLQHAVSGSSVLQRKLADDFTEPVDADLSHTVGRMTEEQQERMEPWRRSYRWVSFRLFNVYGQISLHTRNLTNYYSTTC